MSEINQDILREIGKRVKARREAKSYVQKDVANMTGLTINMISTFENGNGATLSNFLLICRALDTQPKDFFPDDIDLTPLYNIPPESRRRIEVTKKLDDLVLRSDFFDQPRRVAEVLKELGYETSESNKFSVHLSSYCKDGKLKFEKQGNIKRYSKK